MGYLKFKVGRLFTVCPQIATIKKEPHEFLGYFLQESIRVSITIRFTFVSTYHSHPYVHYKHSL